MKLIRAFLIFALCMGGLAYAQEQVVGTIYTQNLASSGSCTAGGCVEINVANKGVVSVRVANTYTGALSAQESTDGVNWTTLGPTPFAPYSALGTPTATISSGATGDWQVAIAGPVKLRITALGAVTGAARIVLQSSSASISSSGGGGGGGASTIADGADVAQGTTTDAAATAGGTGTTSAKLRTVTTNLGAQADAAAAADNSTASLIALLKRTNQNLTTVSGNITSSTGAQADSAAAADNSTASLIALLKRTNQNLSTVNGSITTSNVQLPTALGQTTAAGSLSVVPASNTSFAPKDGLQLTPASLTATGILFTQDMTGYGSVTVQVTSAGSATITYEFSDDGVTFYPGQCVASAFNAGATVASATVSSLIRMECGKQGKYFQARVSAYTSGTVTVVATFHYTPFVTTVYTGINTIQGAGGHSAPRSGSPVVAGSRVRTSWDTTLIQDDGSDLMSDTGGQLITKPYSLSTTDWNYAAATGGITNTATAVTVEAAAASGIRHYVTGICLQTATLGGATEFAIRDGAGGTVLFRTQLQTTAMPMSCHNFMNPLRGTAATLLEIVTLTAVTGSVYANLQGYDAP